MSVLVIGDIQLADIKALVEYADQHRIGEATLKGMVNGTVPPIGDNPRHVLLLPVDYRCVYSIEWQPQESKWFRHLSISIDKPGRAPIEPAIDMIAKAFMFDPSTPIMKWVEPYADRAAINVLQPL